MKITRQTISFLNESNNNFLGEVKLNDNGNIVWTKQLDGQYLGTTEEDIDQDNSWLEFNECPNDDSAYKMVANISGARTISIGILCNGNFVSNGLVNTVIKLCSIKELEYKNPIGLPDPRK